jgi:protocatechuate 3,4-dioxygenase beta subunit
MRRRIPHVCVLLLAVRVAVVIGQQAPSPATGLVTGRVIDGETGAPIPAATVSLMFPGAPPTSRPSRVLTDNAGRFFFDRMPAGSSSITATKPGWIPGELGQGRPRGAAVRLEMSDNARRSDVTIRLWRYGVISGRVLDEQGDPLVGVDVRVFERTFVAGHPRWGYTTRALTDDRGMYRVATLQPGDYVVVVPAAVTAEPSTLRAAQQDQSVYLRTMTGLGAAPMSVGTDATMPVAGADRLITSIFSIVRPPSAENDWLTYQTTLAPSATSPAQSTVVRVRSAAEHSNVDITMRPVRSYQVSGTVTDLDGKPAAFHAVHLLPADSADNPLFDVSTAVSDAGGAFTFHGVPPGEYVARVLRIPPPSGQGRVSTCGGTGQLSFVCVISGSPEPDAPRDPLAYADRTVTVADRSVSGVGMVLSPGARVSGTLQFVGSATTTAAQRANTRVSIEAANGRTATAPGGFELTTAGRLGDDGSFTSPSMWPGRYLLRVTGLPAGWMLKGATYRGRDISDTPFELTGEMDGVVVTVVDRPLTLNGSVTRPAAERDEPLVVLLFPSDRSRWVDYGRTSRQVTSTGVSGERFTMPAPPPGDYLLIAIPDAQASGWQNPATLEKLAVQADRLRVSEGQSVTHALSVRRLR